MGYVTSMGEGTRGFVVLVGVGGCFWIWATVDVFCLPSEMGSHQSAQLMFEVNKIT